MAKAKKTPITAPINGINAVIAPVTYVVYMVTKLPDTVNIIYSKRVDKLLASSDTLADK
jgi:hypothetical protein